MMLLALVLWTLHASLSLYFPIGNIDGSHEISDASGTQGRMAGLTYLAQKSVLALSRSRSDLTSRFTCAEVWIALLFTNCQAAQDSDRFLPALPSLPSLTIAHRTHLHRSSDISHNMRSICTPSPHCTNLYACLSYPPRCARLKPSELQFPETDESRRGLVILQTHAHDTYGMKKSSRILRKTSLRRAIYTP